MDSDKSDMDSRIMYASSVCYLPSKRSSSAHTQVSYLERSSSVSNVMKSYSERHLAISSSSADSFG